jgi:hypothetical protein
VADRVRARGVPPKVIEVIATYYVQMGIMQ